MNNKRGKIDRLFFIFVIFIMPMMITKIVGGWLESNEYNLVDYNGIEVAETMLGVWSGLLGFMITALSILISLGSNTFINILRETPHYKTITLVMIFTCFSLLIGTVIGAIIVLLRSWKRIFFYLILYCVCSTGLALLLSIVYFSWIIIKVNDEK